MKRRTIFCRSAVAGLIALQAACASVTVNSEPRDAEIVVLGPGQEKGKPLGKTPYEGKLSELTDLVSEGPVVIQVRKQGYLPENIVVPDISGARLTLTVQLKAAGAGTYPEINQIVRLTLQAERQLLQKQLDDALATSAEIRKINENVTSSYEIEGSVAFIKGDFEKSRLAWKRSLDIDPDNPDAKNMLKTLDEKLDGKKAK